MIEPCRLFIDFGLVVLIWLVQLIIYPSFFHTNSEDFEQWHRKYTFRISLLVFPLMLAQLAVYFYQVVEQSRLDLSFPLLIVVLLWGHTFLLAAPLHRRMENQERKIDLFRKLLCVNWWRVIGWNLVFLWSFVGYYMRA